MMQKVFCITGAWMLCAAMIFQAGLWLMPGTGLADEPQTILRIGFSASIFGEVNKNDALAAVRVWTQALAKEKDISAIPEPLVLNGIDDIRQAVAQDRVDCVNLTTYEYYQVRSEVPVHTVITGVVSNSITEEYVLLVRADRSFQKLADLKGASLVLLRSARTSLSQIWLDTILMREGLPPADDFFDTIDVVGKTGKAVLPVFFGQADACVVTRSGFDTMIELNPQTGQQLKVAAVSPPVVPVLFLFCGDAKSPVRQQILNQIKNWHLSVAGKQSLIIFQTDSLMEQPVSCLDSAMALIEEHTGQIRKYRLQTGNLKSGSNEK